MKRFNLALHSACLLTCSLVIASLSPAMAAEATGQETTPYQSTFDDYKPLADDGPADWKTINTQSNGSGHANHSMSGMHHQMSPEQMGNMSPTDREMPAMEGMNHSDMKAMDHSQMKHDHAMAPIEGMDHSKLLGMDSVQMKEMSHGTMTNHDHSKSSMGDMNHSMHDSNSEQKPYSHDEAMTDETMPHEHGSEQDHEHSDMEMPSHKPVIESKAQTQHWQIIPNLHPMIVHFPIALTFIAFLLSVASYIRRSHPVSAQLTAAGHFTLWLAAIGAASAVLFGWLAYNSVNHDDAGHAAMLLHRAWAVPTAIGLILLASWDAWKHRFNELTSVPALILLFILSGTIGVTGWLGSEVVYRHGIGVLSLPASEGAGHNHHHHGDATTAANSHDTAETEADEHTEHHHDEEKGESHEH